MSNVERERERERWIERGKGRESIAGGWEQHVSADRFIPLSLSLFLGNGGEHSAHTTAITHRIPHKQDYKCHKLSHTKLQIPIKLCVNNFKQNIMP